VKDTIPDKDIQKIIEDIKSIVAILDPEGFKYAEQMKAEREEREDKRAKMVPVP